MTEDEIIDMARQAGFVDYELDDGTTNAFDKRYEAFAKLVAEKAIKEALAQPEQKPVAVRYDFDGYGYQYIDFGSGSDWQTRVKGELLYTAPSQIKGCAECGVNDNNHALYCVACAERYLKDKNTKGQK